MVSSVADDEEFDLDALRDKVQKWINGASPEAQSAFASSCTARFLPRISGSQRQQYDFDGCSFDLSLLRATLTSAVAATGATADVKDAARVASRAAVSARNLAGPSSHLDTADSALSAAQSVISGNAAYSAFEPFRLAYNTVSNSSAAVSATKVIDQSAPQALFERPLWLDVTWPDAIAKNWTTLRDEWSTDPAMAFWIDWYDGLLIGRTPDWDLWHDIVLIEDAAWDAGPEAVAREIERIKEGLRDKRAGDAERAPEFEPQSVAPLQQNGYLVRAAALSMSGQIESAIDTFLNETGQNCLPATFEPLRGISYASFQIAGLVDLPKPSDEETKRLREEVGRLKAHIAQLEKELTAALASKEAVFGPELKKSIARSIGDWKLCGALVAGLWMISGDDLSMQERLGKLVRDTDELFKSVDEPPKTPEPPSSTFEV